MHKQCVKWIVAGCILSLLGGCEFFALTFAPTKEPRENTTELAQHAHTVFWETLHGGKYHEIPKAMTLLKAAYLQNPHDAKVAAHIGFLHIWRLSERQRLEEIPPQITDDAVLARKYFGEAVRLDPTDARYLGFHSSLLMTEGSLHNDAYLTRKGYYQGLDSIDAWPQFNLFTVGYTLSSKDYTDPRFAEALDMQWQNIDVCLDAEIDRVRPEFARYFPKEATETRPPYKRACWNSWIAPYNLQGFFMNLGDMLVKNGEVETARAVYRTAQQHPDFKTWPFREVLDRRIADAERNVERFRREVKNSEKINEDVVMLRTPFSCMACHQKD